MKKRMAVGMVVCALGCTKQEAKTVSDVVVKVTTELCTEEASDPNEPDFVKLACMIEGRIAHVFLPRTQWQSMKAAADAKSK